MKMVSNGDDGAFTFEYSKFDKLKMWAATYVLAPLFVAACVAMVITASHVLEDAAKMKMTIEAVNKALDVNTMQHSTIIANLVRLKEWSEETHKEMLHDIEERIAREVSLAEERHGNIESRIDSRLNSISRDLERKEDK